MKTSSFFARLVAAALLASIAACSSDSAGTNDAGGAGNQDAATTADGGISPSDAGQDAFRGPFTITSNAIKEGTTMPAEHTCDGADTSPDLTWTEGPEGTKSYALILNDTTIKFLHSSVFDIPKDALALPLGLEKKAEPATPAGVKQTKNYKGTFGYTGPCPPTGEHVYEFVLYALDVDHLPDITTASTLKQVDTAVKAHALGTVRLTAKYQKK